MLPDFNPDFDFKNFDPNPINEQKIEFDPSVLSADKTQN